MLTNPSAPLRKDSAFEDCSVRDGGHVQSEIADLRSRVEQAERALDALPNALFFVDGRSMVVHRNRKADELISRGDGLVVLGGRLCCERGADTTRLHALVAGRTESAAEELEMRSPQAFAVPRQGGATALSAVVTPLVVDTHERSGAGVRISRALVVVTDPDEETRLSVSAIQSQFNLSPAEARLAAALAERQSIQEYADRAGITRHSARSLLKIVFSKTGVRRQSELVLLLARTALWAFRPDALGAIVLSILFVDF